MAAKMGAYVVLNFDMFMSLTFNTAYFYFCVILTGDMDP